MSPHAHLGESERRPQHAAAHEPKRRRSRWLLGAMVATALLLLAVEHRIHVLGLLPWLILLACPLMHLFMHRGHHHGHSPAGGVEGERKPADELTSEREKHHD